ncbi:MAG: DUF5702 domain-containing protein [Lachnospiraceae bacterium]|nr:DUF5702 domain-containing protein [Lachnospiraceae bacterium]
MNNRASITLFMCMTILMITSLGFTLIEVSRFLGVDKKADFVTASVGDNTFSEYIKPLWDQYGILGIDRAHGTEDETDSKLKERILDFASMQLDGDVDYYAISPTNVEINDYMLLTDNDGAAFIHEAATYYKDNIGSELIDFIGNSSAQAGNQEDLTQNVDKLITDSNSSLKNPSSIPNTDEGKTVEIPETNLSDEQIKKGESLLDDVSGFKDKGVLDQVIPSSKEVSAKSFDLQNSVSHRNLMSGNSRNSSKATSIDKIIFSVYLKDHFQNYCRDLGHSGQAYETEYIIVGDDNDTDNLKGVVKRLLAIREVANFITLFSDATKNAEALELATAVAGFTLNPAIIEIVHYGFMAAWAYMEAVLDVRLLLDGGKVLPIKTSADWTSELYNLGNCMSADYTAKDNNAGMSYEDYLLTFLVIESSRDESLRAMDMVETSMNALPYYENLKMDRLICDMNMTITYEADPMFFSLITLDAPFMDFYRMEKKEYRSFL